MRSYIDNLREDLLLHSYNVCRISRKIGEAIGLPKENLEELTTGALVHDIGKIYIEPEILHKNGKLTDYQYSEIKDHPILGAHCDLTTLLSNERIREIVKYHHERWNGTGYPMGLSGKSIPLYARIVAIADSYDAMVVNRGYNEPMNPNDALKEIQVCAGSLYDPELVDVFSKIFEKEKEPKVLRHVK